MTNAILTKEYAFEACIFNIYIYILYKEINNFIY